MAAALSLPLIKNIALYIPEYNEKEKVRNFPESGWLETSIQDRPPFISDNDGHEKFLMFMISSNPVLSHAFAIAHEDFTRNEMQNLDDIFQKNIKLAGEVLTEKFGATFKTLSNQQQLEQQLHVATYVTAGIISPYLNWDIINAIETTNGSETTTNWENPMPLKKFPVVYPTSNEMCDGSDFDRIHRCEGHDRSIHLMQHLFITYLYIYSSMAKTQDVNRIPNAVKAKLKLTGGLYKKAHEFSKLAGYAWEWAETFKDLTNQKDNNKSELPDGALDPLVNLDYMANSTGSLTAIQLFHQVFIEKNTNLEQFWRELQEKISTEVQVN